MTTEFRCTLPARYEKGCPGYSDPAARQGHYVHCGTEEEALAEMKLRFPDETWFQIGRWK